MGEARVHRGYDHKHVAGLGGLYEAHSNFITLRLVNDRGLASFDISPAGETDHWDVELVAGLFDPAGAPVRGVRRLDLAEQAALLIARWEALQRAFQPGEYFVTRARLQALGERRAVLMFGDIRR